MTTALFLFSYPAPSEPTNLTWTRLNDTNALVAWNEPNTPNGPIDGYEISVSELGSRDLNSTNVGRNASSFEVPELVAGTKYTIRLAAYNLVEDLGRLKSEYAELSSPDCEYIYNSAGEANKHLWNNDQQASSRSH